MEKRKRVGGWAGEITNYLVQCATAVQLYTTALSVQVFYRSSSTVRWGIHSVLHKRGQPNNASCCCQNKLYVRTPPQKDINHNAEFSPSNCT